MVNNIDADYLKCIRPSAVGRDRYNILRHLTTSYYDYYCNIQYNSLAITEFRMILSSVLYTETLKVPLKALHR